MIQKLSLLVICILSFSIIGISCKENVVRRGYLLYVTVDSNTRISDDAKIILNGKEIGVLKKLIPLAGKRCLI